MKLSEHRVGDHQVTEHAWDVPLHHEEPGETISVFAREVVLGSRVGDDLPWMVFLQGGPGFEATRPQGSFGWVNRAAQNYSGLLIDQRGTGRSTPVDATSIALRGSPAQQAAYLRLFRADGIVRDCEFVREALERVFSEETAQQVPGISLWLTDEHDHDALRVVGAPILDQLFPMVDAR